jgi:hypothetical protein
MKMLKETLKGAFIAGAVAALFAANAYAGDKPADKPKMETKCAGINSCKGQGSCAGADNSCKSKNSCKGKGWVHTASEKECKDKGGTIVAEKKM